MGENSTGRMIIRYHRNRMLTRNVGSDTERERGLLGGTYVVCYWYVIQYALGMLIPFKHALYCVELSGARIKGPRDHLGKRRSAVTRKH